MCYPKYVFSWDTECKKDFYDKIHPKTEFLNSIFILPKKSGVALTQFSLTLHYNRRVFYYQFYILVKSFFLRFIVDELPAFRVIVYIF